MKGTNMRNIQGQALPVGVPAFYGKFQTLFVI